MHFIPLSVADGITNTYKENNLLQNSREQTKGQGAPSPHARALKISSSSERRGVPTPLVVTYCPTIWKITSLKDRSDRLYTVHFLRITKVQRLTTPDGVPGLSKESCDMHDKP